ncbi:MAG: SPOR domain-containing protein [Gammaproteobacteria bacterium]|nr:SPOR domain-containing protein [Gammaproteobacteria bacterium]
MSEERPSHLKQRVIGAIILVALIVIFVPMLLNNNTSLNQPLNALTARPAAPTAQFPQPSDFAEKSDAVANVTSAPAQAWAVQVGSFTQRSRAEMLMKQLRARGFTSYVVQAKTDKGVASKVYVGPEVKKEQAQDLLQQIKTTMGLKGQLVPFDPLSA